MEPLSMSPKPILSASNWAFLKQFMANPLQVGSVIPSSKHLTDSMFRGIEPAAIKTYVEYGPGTGRFTELAFQQFTNMQRSVLLEINPVFKQLLQQIYQVAEVYNNPDPVRKGLLGQVDLIVSGLPFTHIRWEVTRQTIDDTHLLLRNDGSFRTFLYIHTFFLPKNRLLRAYLTQKFSQVNVRFVCRNFPPAFVIEAHK